MKLVAVVLVATCAVAHADPAPMSAAARAHFERGTAYYETGDYPAAIAELEAGEQAEPHPDFLYALGQAYRKQGDCAHAVEHYLAFLATHPPASEAARVRANITRCPMPTRSSEPPSATDRPRAPTSPSTTDRLRGPASPPATDRPHGRASPPATDRPRAPDPSTALVPSPSVAPRAEPASAKPFYTDVPGGLLAAGGLVGLGVGVTYLVFGERDARAANTATSVVRFQQLRDASDRERTIGVVGTIAGTALAAGAIVRYVMVARHEPEPAVSIAVRPSEVIAVWSGRF